jgi:hypothetical protein
MKIWRFFLFWVVFFVLGTALSAQTWADRAASVTKQKISIALIPFWGDTTDIAAQFSAVLNQLVGKNPDYRPLPINMSFLPPDVPEGGFPPYICPSISMVGGAPFAITGEVTWIDDYATNEVRLYLWEIETRRLVFSDEMQAADRDGCEAAMPSLLEWMLSWLPAPASDKKTAPVYTDKWLYLGLRAGPSFSFYARSTANPFLEDHAEHYYNINGAFQVSGQLLGFLNIQAEAVFTTDYAPFASYTVVSNDIDRRSDPVFSYSLMIPLVIKFTFRRSSHYAAVFGGAYYALPLAEMQNESFGGSFKYSMDLPFGYTAGLNTGMKAGPGFIFLDLRYSADLGETLADSGESVYRRSMVCISLGYEFGLLSKKPKAKK